MLEHRELVKSSPLYRKLCRGISKDANRVSRLLADVDLLEIEGRKDSLSEIQAISLYVDFVSTGGTILDIGTEVAFF